VTARAETAGHERRPWPITLAQVVRGGVVTLLFWARRWLPLWACSNQLKRWNARLVAVKQASAAGALIGQAQVLDGHRRPLRAAVARS
jgi:hypothetical protein